MTGKYGYKKKEICTINSDMKEADRDAVVQAFQDESNKNVLQLMILSTGVGGVGITLTKATTMVLFEPISNVALDAQVVKRFHRVGQDKECTVYRIISDWHGIEDMVQMRMAETKMMTEIFMTFKDGATIEEFEADSEDESDGYETEV